MTPIICRSAAALSLCLTCPWTAVFATTPSTARPNVILIMADDVGSECFGCYGSQQYKTPHLDRLATRGMRFTHCYSQPLCTPSRVKLMTGISNVRNYVAFSILNRDQKTIGHFFQKLGYDTLITGKWQLLGAEQYAPRFRGRGSWPHEAGFGRCCLWQVDRLGLRYWNPLLYHGGTNRQHAPEVYGPDVCTDFICHFIREPHDRPFLIYYPMILVHDPFRPTPDSESRATTDKGQNFEDMVTYMDKLVGRIARQVKESGLSETTLILFTTDNGTNSAIQSEWRGHVVRGGKGKTNDTGTRMPLLAIQPGTVPAGTICEDLVDFSDFLPTLLSAAGGDVPEPLDGQSFWPQLRGESGTPREATYCYYWPRPERGKPVRFARDQRWKLYGDGRFFDVPADPLEERPLDAGSLDSPARLARQKLANVIESMPAKGQSVLKFAPRP